MTPIPTPLLRLVFALALATLILTGCGGAQEPSAIVVTERVTQHVTTTPSEPAPDATSEPAVFEISPKMRECLDDIEAAMEPDIDPDASFEEYQQALEEALQRASEAAAEAEANSPACQAAATEKAP